MYQELFSHKGPIYFIFLKAIGGLIGWGMYQAYVAFICSILIFYGSFFYVLNQFKLEDKNYYVVLFFSLLLLFNQNTNVAFTFFYHGILLLSFWFLIKPTNNYFKCICLASLLMTLAIFVRVDALIYIPLLFYKLFLIKKELNSKKIFIFLLQFIVALFIVYFYLASFFKFSLSDFIFHNFNFNFWYGGKTQPAGIFRPLHILIFIEALFFVPVIIIIINNKDILLDLLKNLQKIKTLFLKNSFLIYVILFFSFVNWYLTYSHKEYFILILLTPLLLYLLLNIEFMTKYNKLLIVCLFSPLFVMSEPILYNLKNYKSCLRDIYCEVSPLKGAKKIVEFIESKPNENIKIISDSGWLYFLTKKQPEFSINNVWFYRFEPFYSKYLLKQHNKLINSPKGQMFIIYKEGITNQYARNQFTDELLNKSELVDTIGDYYLYSIR